MKRPAQHPAGPGWREGRAACERPHGHSQEHGHCRPVSEGEQLTPFLSLRNPFPSHSVQVPSPQDPFPVPLFPRHSLLSPWTLELATPTRHRPPHTPAPAHWSPHVLLHFRLCRPERGLESGPALQRPVALFYSDWRFCSPATRGSIQHRVLSSRSQGPAWFWTHRRRVTKVLRATHAGTPSCRHLFTRRSSRSRSCLVI